MTLKRHPAGTLTAENVSGATLPSADSEADADNADTALVSLAPDEGLVS